MRPMSENTVEPLLTMKEVQSLLKLSRPTIYALMADGDLGVLRFGRAIRFERRAVERLIRYRRKTN